MRFVKLILLAAVLILIAGAGAMYFLSGREAGPTITVVTPDRFIGRATPVSIKIDSPSDVSDASFHVDQNGKPVTISDLKKDVSGNTVTLSGTVAREGLANGPATLTVNAARKAFYGLRTLTSTATKDLTVRLDPPRVAVISIHHFINLGGAEFVVLRATPEDVEAGVQVGDARYKFYPGSSVGISDPAVRVGFFALRHDQQVNTPINAYARDAAGNEAKSPVDHQPFLKK